MTDIKLAKTLTRGSPMASPERTVCIYGESGSGKTTGVMEYLKQSGKRSLYLDLDGNSGPILAAPPEVLDKMNYVKLRNSLTNMSVADFLIASMSEQMLSLCVEHGLMNCGRCKRKQGDVIQLMMEKWNDDYDVVITDSASIMVKAIILFSQRQATDEGERNLLAVWSRVSIIANTMMHFLRECHRNVIVLSHPIDVRHEFQKVVQKSGPRKGLGLVDPYHAPCFGSVKFSREVARGLSATIYANEDGSIITDQKRPYFANARQQIQSTTIAGALSEILD